MAQRLGPVAAEELRVEHFALLRGALERTGGREVKSLGDGLMVVFDGAAQSLECAAQMQQAVEARNRRAEEKLGVRIGVSLGDATVDDGDYYGDAVVEAARLCDRASGGQIIVDRRRLPTGSLTRRPRLRAPRRPRAEGHRRARAGVRTALGPGSREPASRCPNVCAAAGDGYVGRGASASALAELWERGPWWLAARRAVRAVRPGVGKTRLATRSGSRGRTARARPCSTGAATRTSASLPAVGAGAGAPRQRGAGVRPRWSRRAHSAATSRGWSPSLARSPARASRPRGERPGDRALPDVCGRSRPARATRVQQGRCC